MNIVPGIYKLTNTNDIVQICEITYIQHNHWHIWSHVISNDKRKYCCDVQSKILSDKKTKKLITQKIKEGYVHEHQHIVDFKEHLDELLNKPKLNYNKKTKI